MTTPGPLVLLIGSRTGGPLIPLLGLRDDLLAVRPDLRFAMVGVRGGFEEQIARVDGLPIDYLPEVKTPSRPSGPARCIWPLLVPFQWCLLALRLLWATLSARRILLRDRPVLILSMSNFLSVPVLWANRLLGKRRARVAMHQLDIENRTVSLTRRFVDLLSGGLPEICARTGGEFLPNPVRYSRFDALDRESARTLLDSAGLVPRSETRPILLVFGGGSGSQFINDWVQESESALTGHFFVLHLTGFLQEKGYAERQNADITVRQGLTDLMPAALVAADVVMARSGMSTVSELLYLRKNAYLVPIPGSHQEANARAVSRYFRVLHQNERNIWLTTLERDLSNGFAAFGSVVWDYYTPGSRESYRDRLLSLARGAA